MKPDTNAPGGPPAQKNNELRHLADDPLSAEADTAIAAALEALDR